MNLRGSATSLHVYAGTDDVEHQSQSLITNNVVTDSHSWRSVAVRPQAALSDSFPTVKQKMGTGTMAPHVYLSARTCGSRPDLTSPSLHTTHRIASHIRLNETSRKHLIARNSLMADITQNLHHTVGCTN